jgi:hypothetical protein
MARKTPLLLAALAVALVLVSPAGSAPATPTPVGPPDGTVVDSLPVFAWNLVAGADRYEFEIAADPGFNSPVLGLDHDRTFTKNTRATVTKAVPNGTYWWHVRAIGPDGSVSPFSAPLAVVKNWAASPNLTGPANGATITFPSDALQLSWAPTSGAVKYRLIIATDPALGSVIWSTGPVETQATSFTLSAPLPGYKTYYWGITPIDASGNRGTPSEVRSFTWVWPSTTTTRVTDIAAAPEIQDHEFSWDPVPGAIGYELEVNKSVDFASGSKVCCDVDFLTKVTTIGTTYTPAKVLENNNDYYWRVRAVDPSKNQGDWNVGPRFSKGFDNVLPSVRNLRMVDNPFPAEEAFETTTPIVAWDPVPGASAYRVEVVPWATDRCDWSAAFTQHWRNVTATPAWTPLGDSWNGSPPYSSSLPVSRDLPTLVLGQAYCVRVTALDRPSDILSEYRASAETYLPDVGAGTPKPAFVWTGPPAGNTCSPSCAPFSVGQNDYLAPIRGTTTARMPYFRWNPIAGFESYYVLVSKDPNFTNLVDYAFTQVPAYAPRTQLASRTYPDETNEYFWAVLPAVTRAGGTVSARPGTSAPSTFHKQSIPPALVTPTDGTVFAGPARFHWQPAEAARRYRLQVSQDPTFATNIVEDIVTDSTAYTSSEHYAADVNLYWRVRADDENEIGLTWSSPTRTFQKTLPAPVPDPANATSGDLVPTWKWSHVQGARSYDLEVKLPDGTTRNLADVPSRAFTATLMKGSGIWQWRARANFPMMGSVLVTEGPWSPNSSFTRTIREPGNPTEEFGERRLVFRWDPKPAAFNYRVQISTRSDFGIVIDQRTTDIPRWAPTLLSPLYAAGGTFYWRVAAADDAVLNVGDFTTQRAFTLPAIPMTPITITPPATQTTLKLFRLGARGYPIKGRRVAVTIRVKNRTTLQPIAGARVRASGAGITPRTKTTGLNGSVRFYIKATRLGRVTFRATKSGYQTAFLYRQVRRR